FTAILAPAAVGALLRRMPYAYMTNLYVAPRRSPFSRLTRQGGTRRGERVFDPRVRLVSEPGDPDGGYPPFSRHGGVAGLPIERMTWVDDGVLQDLSYDVGEAIWRGRQPHPAPRSVRLEASPGTTTRRLEEMVAGCEH